ncbi:MAG: DUF5996 family protein [Pacificimonas sp.]|jgi:hypothetical protein|nr:DUF5996 family protein [Pacificimonas sp.]
MRWPALDYPAEREVYETVHAWLQVVGKLPVRTTPWVNHGWHVAMRVVPRGFRTYVLPTGEADYELLFDILGERVLLTTSAGFSVAVPLTGQTVAAFHAELSEKLAEIGAPAPLQGGPNEVPDPAIPFDQDHRERMWDAEVAGRMHGAFLSADRVFSRFRSGFVGKSSPSHLFFGSFDLAVTRFSGRRAPTHPGGFPNLPDPVTREAYSHEVVSAGFWTGGGGVDEAAFYAYTYPAKDAFGAASLEPGAAYWLGDLSEFVLPYAAVAGADDPDAALMAFLQSTYEAGAKALGFPADLTEDIGPVGQPPRRYQEMT